MTYNRASTVEEVFGVGRFLGSSGFNEVGRADLNFTELNKHLKKSAKHVKSMLVQFASRGQFHRAV